MAGRSHIDALYCLCMHLRPLIRFFIYKLNEGKKKQKKIARSREKTLERWETNLEKEVLMPRACDASSSSALMIFVCVL